MTPILATDEADEPTRALAAEILELLGRDVWEEERARLIHERHEGIGEEEYMAVWTILDAPTRRAWKEYVRQWTQHLSAQRRA